MHFDDAVNEQISKASLLLRAIAHPLRINMLNYIEAHQPVKVHNIHSDLDLDQSITSQHLKIMRDSGIVETERKGKFIYYVIGQELLTDAIHAINKFDILTLQHRKKKR